MNSVKKIKSMHMTIAANIHVTITKERDHWTNQQMEYMEEKKTVKLFHWTTSHVDELYFKARHKF
jgi:hypothetical protein